MRAAVFESASVFLSRSLVPPEAFDAVHDALRLNGARVFLCCDPSRNAPSDFHVISSLDHVRIPSSSINCFGFYCDLDLFSSMRSLDLQEKFEYLRSKGCKLIGPQCVLSCAKEHRCLPDRGYTCCLAMVGVKVLASGFEKDEKVKIEQLVTGMGGELHMKASLDIDFVVVKNVLAAKYKWALNVLKKPIVNMTWVYQCWTEHRFVPQEPFKVPPFSGLTVCVTRIPAACLDEGFYPVAEAPISCNNMKTSQKEPGNQPQSSEPIPPTEFGDLDTTLSQNMSSSFSDATKTNMSMIRKGGGSRHMLLSEKLTHIIIGTPSEIEKKEVRRLAAWGVINVVKATWLEECDLAKRELPVSLRHLVSDLVLPKDSTCSVWDTAADLCSSKKGKNFTGTSHMPTSQFGDVQRAEIIEWVKEGGGVMIDHRQMKNANFIIETHGSFQDSTVALQSIVISPHWIRFCLEEGCIQDVGNHVLFSPLRCKIPLPGFAQIHFCVSQYEEKDRILLRNLCHTLGAKFTEKLTKKVTHLICKFTSGPKYEAACKWGIHSITAEWITECVKQETIVSLEPFWPKAATAQDREAGLCTVSQYPTQAAHMVIGNVSSQLLSDSQVPMECQNADTGVVPDNSIFTDPKNSKAFTKRPRLSESDSMNVTSHKNRMTEDLKEVPNAVPDVADAIEDLLAQSNKMQDMKSPGSSGCDRSTFSPQHPIIGQNHAGPHSNFEIARPWLSRDPKQDKQPNPSGHNGNLGSYDTFSETQTESQVVGYEEDLSGRQKIIDRVRSQSMTMTPEKYTEP
ncbi:hypothetical protein J5N97_021157 [Dioscorea zingiberensis]|uniref:BRCT domain-containing protein n=1 Tax=Dioscorea zingiberensis TaxID=325984 RepID=A0A9D5CH57_9LILI|nr:hypothetical protein J5N97_021157 [Dioscorea zingiberensis]